MDTNRKEYQRLFLDLDSLYKTTGMGLTSPKPRNVLLGLTTNFIMIYIFMWDVYYAYSISFESTNNYIVTQQAWAALAIFQIPSRGFNRLVHWDEMSDVIKWFEEIYSKKMDPEYQQIIDRNLKRQNYLIKYVFWFLKLSYITGALLYTFYPLASGSEHLPTPIVMSGVIDTEFSSVVYWTLFIMLAYNAYKLAFSALSNECFFAMSIFIFGYRFTTIRDILNLLNYSGPRDKMKDKEVLKMCYIMHTELLKHIRIFLQYFNKLGLVHIACPLLSDSILLYNLFEDGLDLLFVGIYLVFFIQIVIGACFAQLLSGYADEFYLGIYNLNWMELDIQEQKAIRMLLMRSQATLSITVGSLYKYNFALVTKILKLQLSFCAVLQTL